MIVGNWGRNQRIMSKRFFLGILVIGLFLPAAAIAQTAAFTYQGRLNDGGNPANGNYDVQFRLFDNPNVGQGAQQGATITNPTVAVANGNFAVSLDFGAAVFASGADRFLEISIRPSGSTGGYTSLAPRQKLTSSPYSVRSSSSNSADNLSNVCVGCVQNSQINSLDGNKVTGAVANSTNAVNATTANNSNQLGGLPIQRFVKFELDGTVSIGTTGTGSTLTVGGVIESTTGGIKFPDGSQQSTAGLTTVTTNSTLTGDGTGGSPLGINSPIMVRDLDNPAFQPVNFYTTNSNVRYTVPSGKRLVIEYVSGSVTWNDGFAPIRVIIYDSSQSVVVIHEAVAQRFFSLGNGNFRFQVSQMMRAYADSGNTVQLSFFSLGTDYMSFAGYLVDVPQPSVNAGGKTNVQKK